MSGLEEKTIGLDLGGTKLEARVFASDWSELSRRRIETPNEYSSLLSSLAELIAWGELEAGGVVPTGVSAAGIVEPKSQRMLTSNLCATGKRLPADLAETIGRPVAWMNDARALALSEAMLGAGRGHRSVQSVVIGTGLGGGLVVDGAVQVGASGAAGEVGHTALPARFGLHDVVDGRPAIFEDYLSGPGLSRLASGVSPEEAVAGRHGAYSSAWDRWCGLLGELVRTLTLIVDPDVIVFGGGLSRIEGLLGDLAPVLANAKVGPIEFPELVIAEGGPESGARGAAYEAKRSFV